MTAGQGTARPPAATTSAFGPQGKTFCRAALRSRFGDRFAVAAASPADEIIPSGRKAVYGWSARNGLNHRILCAARKRDAIASRSKSLFQCLMSIRKVCGFSASCSRGDDLRDLNTALAGARRALLAGVLAAAAATAAAQDGGRKSRPASVPLPPPRPADLAAPPPAASPPPTDPNAAAFGFRPLPAAPRERMHACGEEWRKMKIEGAARNKTWRDFADDCLRP